jgi:Lrp/AsnC family transcriptional regulator, leucine-responsive regulatory protein
MQRQNGHATLEIEKLLDETGWRLLDALQQNARLSYTELGQRVGLSLPAVTERIRRMEDAGIITGYHAEVNMAKLGLRVLAIVRIASIGGQTCAGVVDEVSAIPEVLECYRVIGSDSITVKVAATSVDHLARVLDQLSVHGIPSTSIVHSRPMKRQVQREALAYDEDELGW